MTDIGIVLELYKFAVSYSILMARQVMDAEDYLQECLIVILVCARRYAHLEDVELLKLCKEAARNRIRRLANRKTWERKRFIDLEYAETVAISEEKQMQARLIIEKIFLCFPHRKKVFSMLMKGYGIAETSTRVGLSSRHISRLISQAKQVSIK